MRETDLMAIWPKACKWHGAHFVLVEIKVFEGFVEANQPPALILVWDSPRQKSALDVHCGSPGVLTRLCIGAASPWAVIAETTASKPAEVTGTRERFLGHRETLRVQELAAQGSALLGLLFTEVCMPAVCCLKKQTFPLPFFNLEWCIITNICWSCLLMVFTGRYFPLCLPKRLDAVPQYTALL